MREGLLGQGEGRGGDGARRALRALAGRNAALTPRPQTLRQGGALNLTPQALDKPHPTPLKRKRKRQTAHSNAHTLNADATVASNATNATEATCSLRPAHCMLVGALTPRANPER